MRTLFQALLLAALLCLLSAASFAQESPASQEPPAEKPKPQSVSPRVRLAAAHSVYIKNLGGNDIPLTLITNAIVGWPRFVVLDEANADKADIVIEVSAPQDPDKDKDKSGDTGVTAGYNGRKVVGGNKPAPTSTVPTSDVKMIVRDPRTHAVLWAGTEQAKEAFRRNKQDENLETAAQKLIQRFEQALEPDSAKKQE